MTLNNLDKNTKSYTILSDMLLATCETIQEEINIDNINEWLSVVNTLTTNLKRLGETPTLEESGEMNDERVTGNGQ